MDDAKFLFFCYMMDEGDFSPLQFRPIPTVVFMDTVGICKVMKPLLSVDRFVQAESDMNEFEIYKSRGVQWPGSTDPPARTHSNRRSTSGSESSLLSVMGWQVKKPNNLVQILVSKYFTSKTRTDQII